MKKTLLTLLICFFVQILPAQTRIILEELRCASLSPTMVYWKNEEVRKTFAGQLNALLLKHWHLPLADTTTLNIRDLNEELKNQKQTQTIVYTDTPELHMFLEVFESSPAAFFNAASLTKEDSLLMKSTKTVFFLRVILNKGPMNIVLKDTLDILVSTGTSPGIGIESPLVAMMPKGFTEMLKSGFDILLNPENDITQIQMKIAPAFISDNYVTSNAQKRPRVYVTVKKDISTYAFNDKREMIRMGEAVYEEIKLKGKKTEPLAPAMMDAIRNTAHYPISDYVFLKQDWRDVGEDRNYLLKMLVQIDPENPSRTLQHALTNFVAGNFHYLLHEKDTVAFFSVKTRVPDPARKLYANRVSNGFDSLSIPIVAQENQWPFLYDYVVTGKISGQDFTIKCGGYGNTLKEIYLKDKFVAIAQGKFSPEKFVVFDASLSPELLKPLFMIGFNRFFE
jgi:hypothetical protein